MRFVWWSVLFILFALTESAPKTEQPSANLSFNNEFDKAIATLLRFYQPYWNGSYETSSEDDMKIFRNQSNNGILQNVTVGFLRWPPARAELPSHKNDSFTVSGQLKSLYLEGYLRNPNRHVVTEILTLDYVVKLTVQNEVSVSFPYFNQNKIKLRANNDYSYKLTEEAELKTEIVTHMKTMLKEFIVDENKDSWTTFKHNCLGAFSKFLFNAKENDYFIESIKSTKYTLRNVTIRGLWNPEINLFNVSVLEAFPEIEMSRVSGSMVRDSPAGSADELSYSADKVHISVDQIMAKVNVNLKTKGYSVVNGKLNSPLSDEESKAIIGAIESAFAASLEPTWKITKPRP